MAIAVTGGMITSTLLSLILIPVLYELVDSFEMRLLPKLARIITPKREGDDDPLPEELTS
jgi:HAE1 family hydrophobic/amphiphilic exporter-1